MTCIPSFDHLTRLVLRVNWFSPWIRGLHFFYDFNFFQQIEFIFHSAVERGLDVYMSTFLRRKHTHRVSSHFFCLLHNNYKMLTLKATFSVVRECSIKMEWFFISFCIFKRAKPVAHVMSSHVNKKFLFWNPMELSLEQMKVCVPSLWAK